MVHRGLHSVLLQLVMILRMFAFVRFGGRALTRDSYNLTLYEAG